MGASSTARRFDADDTNPCPRGTTSPRLRAASADLGPLTATLHALDRPALLLLGGDAVIANAPGAPHVAEVLAWDRAGRPAGFADAAPLFPGGVRVDLVLPRARTLPTLPPSLRKVGALLGEGLSDKDIADRLGMPLVTVRTYVARVLARSGARSRRALMSRR